LTVPLPGTGAQPGLAAPPKPRRYRAWAGETGGGGRNRTHGRAGGL